jgi:hypothetical protein
VVLDEMHPSGDARRIEPERHAHGNGDVLDPAVVPATVQDEPRARPVAEREERLAEQIRPRIAGDRKVVDLLRREAGHFEADADRVAREAGPVFYAAEAFFFDGGDERAVAKQRSRDVTVVGVDAENVHASALRMTPKMFERTPDNHLYLLTSRS